MKLVYIVGAIEMKKVCIVTICNGSNFGNRLQNYALQETIRLNTESDVVTVKNIAGELFRSRSIFYKIMQNILLEKIILRLLKHPKIRKKLNLINLIDVLFYGRKILLTVKIFLTILQLNMIIL